MKFRRLLVFLIMVALVFSSTFVSTSVSAATGVDLIITGISWSPVSPTEGDVVRFSATIKNQGTVASPAGVFHSVWIIVDGVGVSLLMPTESIAPGQSKSYTVTDSTWVATKGTHTISAVVDDTNRIPETDETNNTFSTSLSILPDLIITDITTSPANPTEGDHVVFSATIKNQGKGSSPAGVYHSVWINVDGVGVSLLMPTDSIAPGQSKSYTVTNSYWTATSGTHTLSAIVDDTNRIPESNEANNTFSKSLSILPDLIVTDINISPANYIVGDNVTFSATIKNQGRGSTPAGVDHAVTFQVDGVTTNIGVQTASIAPGNSVTITSGNYVNGPTWKMTPGSHTITAWVDDVNRIPESDETNNKLNKSLSNLPDLIITDITTTPSNPIPGDHVVFSATIKNQGKDSSPAGVYHSVWIAVDGNNISLLMPTDSIAPGQSKTYTVTNSYWTAVDGSHTVSAIVDDTNRIPESDENNNTFSKGITVGKPDLIVTDVTCSPLIPVEGDTVTFKATIKNQGSGSTSSGVSETVAFKIDGITKNLTAQTGVLAPGQSVTVTSVNSNWSAVAGNHSLTAVVDFTNIISETDESNNGLGSSISVLTSTYYNSLPHVMVLVNTNVFAGLQDSLGVYKYDILKEGYRADIVEYTLGNNPALVRGLLQDKYSETNGLLKGAFFIGNIPYAQAKQNWEDSDPGSPAGLCDLYYDDLDGSWTDTDNDGAFELHGAGIGDKYPEIWSGRLYGSNLSITGKDELTLYKEYFNRNHLFRTKATTLTNKGLYFTQSDQVSTTELNGLKALYPDTVDVVTNGAINSDELLKAEITKDYDWMHVIAHSNSGSLGGVSSSYIISNKPKALFYNTHACTTARFIDQNYVAGTCLLGTNALEYIGSTTVAVYYPEWDAALTTKLYNNGMFGEALNEIYNYAINSRNFTDAVDWTGQELILLGDPTLKAKY